MSTEGLLTDKIIFNIQKKLNKITTGYNIISKSQYEDFNGKKLYFISCENNWCGNEYEYYPAIKKDINEYIKEIIENGITINSITYYFHTKSNIYKSYIFLTSKDNFYKLSINKDNFYKIIQKYKIFLVNEYEKNKYNKYKSIIIKSILNKIDQTALVNNEIFFKSLKYLLNEQEYQKLHNDFINNIYWTEKEKQMLFC